MRHGMEAISLWHCGGVMEAQIALIAAVVAIPQCFLLWLWPQGCDQVGGVHPGLWSGWWSTSRPRCVPPGRDLLPSEFAPSWCGVGGSTVSGTQCCLLCCACGQVLRVVLREALA
ncbi:hypothetical protein CHARACLAT_017969 [Characodon lateralis]|uniref:Secreted protein n=1 Tax=Characodon lateralis TaxID=208331 RepID=A0ABU7CPP2_9TELE|nr:hypothetical protein [Characodon lateralis]